MTNDADLFAVVNGSQEARLTRSNNVPRLLLCIELGDESNCFERKRGRTLPKVTEEFIILHSTTLSMRC